MMDIFMLVTTIWIERTKPGGGTYRDLKLSSDYPGFVCGDYSGQPSGDIVAGDPVVVEVRCKRADYDAFIADPGYGPGAVLWSEEL